MVLTFKLTMTTQEEGDANATDTNACESLRSHSRRHYKKDSRFVFDLYTLCYDENESVDTVELFTSIVNNTAGNWMEERRSDREEIRRRLAMGAEENCNDQQTHSHWKSNSQSRLQNGMSSDTESHSSDSETCPKLSKSKTQSSINAFGAPPATVTVTHSITNQTTDNNQLHPYHGRPLSVSCSNNIINNNTANRQMPQQLSATAGYSNEDLECDFFTKQAKLQIEARMALAQAKEMAHMQMEIERQNQSISPITAIIRGSLEKIGVRMAADKRRVSRQMLTEMNIAQLQILVNNLHTHIEELNESLVNYLMERDDLHDSQDAMLVDIEELTRYIGAKEHIAQQERISAVNKRSK